MVFLCQILDQSDKYFAVIAFQRLGDTKSHPEQSVNYLLYRVSKKKSPLTKYDTIAPNLSFQRLKTKDEFCSNTRFAFQ